MERFFTRAANLVAHLAGKPATFLLCCLVIVTWAASGPVFGFSDTWQLIINTGTTIVTFLMVFLIQNTQNRDGAAIQAKLDELIRAGKGQNRFIGIEHLTEGEVEQYRQLCERAASRARHAEAKAERAEAEHAEGRAEEAEEDAERVTSRAGEAAGSRPAHKATRKKRPAGQAATH
jgi:low affinity Fe/Cu permease